MKTGIAICLLIVAVLAGLCLLDLREPVDHATAATAPQALLPAELPKDLPELFEPDSSVTPGAGFGTLLWFAQDATDTSIAADDAEREASDAALCDALHRALASPFSEGFADARVTANEMLSDELRQLFRDVSDAVGRRLAAHLEAGDYAAADRLAKAHFELGRRLFTQNTRLRARQHGLGMMHAGLAQAQHVAQAMAQAPDDPEPPETPDPPDTPRPDLDTVAADLDAWALAVAGIDAAWRSKLQLIASAKPNVADLIRVAQHDGDRSFRVFATYQLGYARFEVAEPGNQRMIAQAIDQATRSDDPLLRQAALFARGMSREQFYAHQP